MKAVNHQSRFTNYHLHIRPFLVKRTTFLIQLAAIYSRLRQ
jgi:hypothetical protein